MIKLKAYVETAILADVLIKTGSESDAAKDALRRYKHTLLPVYAIKKFKARPLAYVSYLNTKLLDCGSYPATLMALSRVVKQPNRVATCLRLLSELHNEIVNQPQTPGLVTQYGSLAEADKRIYASLVYESKVLVLKAWLRCSTLTTEIVDDLVCYERVAPKVRRNGRYNLQPTTCKTEDCCMTSKLRDRSIELNKLVTTIKKEPAKRENPPRQRVLHDLAVRKNFKMKDKDCKNLGDAVFALFCPADADILTTNISDHRPLAEALGKTAVSPKDVVSSKP